MEDRIAVLEHTVVRLSEDIQQIRCELSKKKKRTPEFCALKSRQMKAYHKRLRKAKVPVSDPMPGAYNWPMFGKQPYVVPSQGSKITLS